MPHGVVTVNAVVYAMPTLLTYAGNTHALQSLIVARYNGVEIEVPAFEMGKDNKTEAFLAKSPMGKVPVLETSAGCICEATAIARYVARMRADTNMYGSSFFESGLVDQWVEFAKNELDLPVGMWIYPILGFIQSNDTHTAQAKKDLAKALAVLEAHLITCTFLVGEAVTLADIVVSCSLLNAFKLAFDAAYLVPFPAVLRWFTTCVNQPEFLAVIGTTTLNVAPAAVPVAPAPAPGPAAPAPADSKKEKKEKKKKEDKPKEEKEDKPKPREEAPAADEAAKAAAKAAKEREKLLKAIIKEGGKKGVEIEGASDMGGLDFFCTTIELPEGDIDLLQMAMTAMNAQPDPEAEDRKGCSGHVGKMIFSAGVKQLACVAYVPGEGNKSSELVPIDEWSASVAAAVGGTAGAAKDADSPNGGKVVEIIVAADADKGKFPIKDKDTAMAAAFAFLRSKGAFPEDNDDDSDDMIFGDDTNLDDYE